MKKVINRKVYDTKTAKEIACSSDYSGGIHWYDETLYRKKTGEFFLYGKGGCGSKYAVSIGCNSWAEGSGVIPLSQNDAYLWCEKNIDSETLADLFGDIVEDESKQHITITLKTELIENLRTKAKETGVTLSLFIESILERN